MDMKASRSLTDVGLPIQIRTANSVSFRQLTEASNGPERQATKWSTQETGDHSDEDKLPRVVVKPSPGRGFGLFATSPIPAYTKIIEDDALISLTKGEDLPELWMKYHLLSSDLKETFDGLSFPIQEEQKEQSLIAKLVQRGYDNETSRRMTTVRSKFQANAFKTGSTLSAITTDSETLRECAGMEWAYAVFPIIARINHSCTPNTHAHYSPSSGAQLLYTLRDIECGEELEICYFDFTMLLPDRQARAKSWGFSCNCPACSTTGSVFGSEYERRLAKIHRNVGSSLVPRRMAFDRVGLMADINQAIENTVSTQNSWLVAALPNLYCNLGQTLATSDDADAEVIAALEKALEWERKITGDTSPSSTSLRTALIKRRLPNRIDL